jgi:hypothetical protein
VTFTGLSSHRGYGLRVNGHPFSQAIHGNDFWQTDYDPATRRWSQAFNLPRDDGQPLEVDFGPAAAENKPKQAETSQNEPRRPKTASRLRRCGLDRDLERKPAETLWT